MSRGASQKIVETGTVFNGIDLAALRATIDAIEGDQELGACQLRASNTWLSGSHSRSTVTDFYGAKQEITHRQKFTIDADEPAILAGDDNGANPGEYLLHALAACMTTSVVAHAAVRGIRIEELESRVEGDIDLNGYFGLSDEVPKGFSAIRVSFRVKADPVDVERIRELALFSPVFNTVTHGVNVAVNVELK